MKLSFYHFFIAVITFLISGQMIYCQNGIIRSFYEKGKPRYEISYADDHLEGTSYWYYPNGNLKEEKTYSRGVLNGWLRSYYSTGLLREEIYLVNGVKDGVQKKYYENGGLERVMTFENGKLIKNVEVEFDSLFKASIEAYKGGYRQKLTEDQKKEILCNVDICPEPLGGYESIYKNLEYPEHAKLFGLEGVVTLVATINESGDVINTVIVKGLDLGCSQAAQKAVEMTRFLPGQDNGKIVQSQVTIDIEFKLERKPVEIITVDETEDKIATDSLSKADTGTTGIRFTNSTNCGIDECPKLKSGLLDFTKTIILPPVAQRLKVEGEIIIEAEIDEFGFVRSTSVLQGIGYGCDEAVEHALYSAEFYPGKLNGKDVYSTVILKIPVLQNIPEN